MKNIFIMTVVLIICGGCMLGGEARNDNIQRGHAHANKKIIGGWYPVFFKNFQKSKIETIVKSIKDEYVKRIIITYDKNKKLAEKIKRAIQEKVNFAIKMKHVDLESTEKVEYNRDKVVATIYQ